MNELNSPMLKLLDDKEFHVFIKEFLTELTILTGAVLYEEPSKLKMQIGVIKRYIRGAEKFMTLTTNEVRHAFYMNQQGMFSEVHKHYNREINCEFLGDVLQRYIVFKKLLYDRAGRHITNLIDPPAEIKCLPIGETDWEYMIQADYEHYKREDYGLIRDTTTKYFFLRRRSIIKYADRLEYNNWWHQAFAKMEHEERKNSVGPLGTPSKLVNEKYEEIKKTGQISRYDYNKVLHILRRLVYLDFLRRLADLGIQNLFAEVEYKK